MIGLDMPSIADKDARKAEIIGLLPYIQTGIFPAKLQAYLNDFPDDPWGATVAGEFLYRRAADERDRSARSGRKVGEQVGRDFENAVEILSHAVKLEKRSHSAYFFLGLSLQGLGRPADATAAFLAALKLRFDASTASRLLEAVVAVQGVDFGRSVYAELMNLAAQSGVSPDEIKRTWATLLLEAGCLDDAQARELGFRCGPLLPVMDWAERNGVAPDFTDACEDIPVEDPRMIGGLPVPLFKGTVRGYRPYVCTVPDATVMAKSDMVLTADGAILNDVATDARFGHLVAFFHDKAVVKRSGDRILIDRQRYEIGEIDAAILLSGGAAHHFGHWVPEFLCRLAVLVEHPAFAALPIVVDAEMPESQFEYLRLLVDNEILRLPPDRGLRCRRLVIAPPPSFFPVFWFADNEIPTHEQGPFSPRCFRFLRDRILARLPPAGVRNRRLYLSRGKRQWRYLQNDAEIADHLRALGFEVVHPEEHSFADQVRLFQEAEAIVSPSGSVLLNLIFADPSVKLLVLNQAHLFSVNGFYGPMRALGYEPHFLCGTDGDPVDKHAAFTIPLERLREGLQRIGL
ncbi:glycosyltransferase family 61 protein [Azospirillum sp. HJ39]|uniref:glycosyltransferase family 61 protein n=1 Tax=Azospirillum sp. HJ39 TaxID=3159496 RepID=UPI00355872F8